MNEALQPHLLPLVRARFGPHAELRAVRRETIRREVQRFILEIEEAAGAQPWSFIGKLMPNPRRGEKVFHLMRGLWQNGFSREAEDGICIPEPLGFMPEPGLLLMEEAPGRKVRNLINNDGNPAHMKVLARTLAKLHRSPHVTDKRVDFEDYIPRAHEKLSEAFPALKESIAASITAARAAFAHVEEENFALVHGDFHLAQVHVEGSKAWLLDLDGVKLGDPASDVGNVLALLHGKEEQLANLRELMRAFWEEYLAHVPAHVAARVPLYLGLALVRRACKYFREQEPEAADKIERMVKSAAACMKNVPTQSVHGARQDFSALAALLDAPQ